jgi:hypothetical protein
MATTDPPRPGMTLPVLHTSATAAPPAGGGGGGGGGGGDDSGGGDGGDGGGVTVTLAGKELALQAVAQAASMAVTDAVAHLRRIGAISTAGLAVCTELMIKNKDTSYGEIMTTINQTLTTAAETFQTIGDNAAGVLKQFS